MSCTRPPNPSGRPRPHRPGRAARRHLRAVGRGGELVLEGAFPEPSGTHRRAGGCGTAATTRRPSSPWSLAEGGGFRAVLSARPPSKGRAARCRSPRAAGTSSSASRASATPTRTCRCACRPPHADAPPPNGLAGAPFTLERRYHDRLVLESGSALPVTRAGPVRAAAASASGTPDARRRPGPLRDAVLYTSFDGRQYSDSPRAIHEELAARGPPRRAPLGRPRPAGRRARRAPAPSPCTAPSGTRRSPAAATSSPTPSCPSGSSGAEGQVVVQTWHGTPLKRIGLDLAGTAHADAAYIATMEQRAASWSVLVSPNSFSHARPARAPSATRGEMLESGYPRNDLLHAPDRTKVAAAVRRAARRSPTGKRVVLYAPTWRDDRPTAAAGTTSTSSSTWTQARERARRRPRPAGAPPLPGRRRRPRRRQRLRAGRLALPGRRRAAA